MFSVTYTIAYSQFKWRKFNVFKTRDIGMKLGDIVTMLEATGKSGLIKMQMCLCIQ